MNYSSRAWDEDWKYATPKKASADGYLPPETKSSHRIYWHEYGNPKGEPVLFVHGGPGGATAPETARFFNPDRYRIILFDQRGCGRSQPGAARDSQAALTHNTTQDLISDMVRLRQHLGIAGKMHLFGGSWGSTLSLAYAIAHPQHVQTLILRGIFLCRKKDIDYFYQGNAATYHLDPYDTRLPGTYLTYPEAWKKFVGIIPVKERKDMVKAYARIFAAHPKTAKERKRQDEAASAWTIWEGSTSLLAQDLSNLGSFAEPAFAKAFAQIENHYFMNGAFFTGRGQKARNNNYLLDNIGTIKHLPFYIVQGQYDQVCPRFQADELVAALQKHKAKVEYILTPAGHGAPELVTMQALVEIMDTLPAMKA